MMPRLARQSIVVASQSIFARCAPVYRRFSLGSAEKHGPAAIRGAAYENATCNGATRPRLPFERVGTYGAAPHWTMDAFIAALGLGGDAGDIESNPAGWAAARATPTRNRRAEKFDPGGSHAGCFR